MKIIAQNTYLAKQSEQLIAFVVDLEVGRCRKTKETIGKRI